MKKNTIGVTIGDPGGIGPEIIAKLLLNKEFYAKYPFVPVAPKFILDDAFTNILKTDIPDFDMIDLPFEQYEIIRGESTAENGAVAMESLMQIVEMADKGKLAGIVTCPVHKFAAHKAGVELKSQTDFIANMLGVKDYTTLIMSEKYLVSLVTSHVPIRQVADAITVDEILKVIKNVNNFGPFLGMDKPKIAVCGLNPHAGDHGTVGDEEINIITPAINKACRKGYDVSGPYPADTLFANEKEHDIIVAMYHDQGLIPVRSTSFVDSVNISLNFPIVRTSVDHGTAYQIAGQGIANERGLKHAIKTAHKIVAFKKGA